MGQVLYVSATPAAYELESRDAAVAEQIIRPTGLTDPAITVRPAGEQVDDLMEEIRGRAERGERVLVTTLTKRMAEDLTQYYLQMGLRVRYLHSDIDTLERVEVIRDLRLGKFDALIGINLLREGLDLPEVSLVAILDADKEGYLRSATSLVQTSGRAARNVRGEVIMYADKITDSMRTALGETERRGAHPGRVQRRARDHPRVDPTRRSGTSCARSRSATTTPSRRKPPDERFESAEALTGTVKRLEGEMKEAAKRLDFERAAELRDRLRALRKRDLSARELTRPPPLRAEIGHDPARPRRDAGKIMSTGLREAGRGTRREARAPPRPAGRLPLQGRQGPGGLRGKAASIRAASARISRPRAPGTRRRTRWSTTSPTSTTSSPPTSSRR